VPKRLASYEVTDSPDQFWDEQEILILREQAEAVFRYDPVFSSDPLAH
jgi:hypothetical protein